MFEEYPNFIYKDYKIIESDNKITFKFDFEIEGLENFNHEIEILKKDFKWKNLKSKILKNIVFNLGLVESISYFKATCSKNYYIKCGKIDNYQEAWFKKLFFLGLGEFRYKNNIKAQEEDFVNFHSLGEKIELEEDNSKLMGILIPIGGGKDSCVTTELLKNKFNNIDLFRVGINEVSIKCAEASGFPREKIVEVTRKIDKTLLSLNERGFLNGHTPFSAMIAFLSYSISYMLGKKYIALSNENSANESNVEGENINHQYSKTFEFENDFREYAKRYLKCQIEYFSFLRPISELQIAMLFSRFKKYHKVFKSCNVGSKQEPWVWCGNCPKCLFVYIILSSFLSEEELKSIFGKNLYEDEKLLKTFIELAGFGEIKPFECVGTYSEVRFCINKNIENRKNENLPFLLKYYKEHYNLEKTDNNILKSFNENNNLPEKFKEILKENL